ncbi:DUF2145 domain-containing protein [Pseudoduganella chitinolytica]|uniref:DUF2145 domain-containing protein n=1 Tax=Pseudoduganella chitinolytica TaxID=34070 RepID=A0ABY8B968_9BURK|nr:DUF2145 domain-containing protein [Pseudoduganella chitinolytica]WEF31297.1 DUF2145 domain-containing protein [Pseudoduganella chitinolytica]
MKRWLLVACLTLATPAWAGRHCEEKPLSVADTVKSMDLAKKTFDTLDASGAQVALVSRVGQDLSKYGLKYSHMGIVVRDHPEGRWTVVHELNECGTAGSNLYNEGLGNFFLSDLYRYEAEVVIPDGATQERLAQLVASRTARRLHEPKYNMLSYVYSTRYQNSNQWVLETYAAAAAPKGQVETRAEAQNWLKQAGYAPVTIRVRSLTRLGGRMFRANVAFDDHPFERRMAGQIDTVTTVSIVNFVRATDPQAKVMYIE